jgi:hypothetical protein
MLKIKTVVVGMAATVWSCRQLGLGGLTVQRKFLLAVFTVLFAFPNIATDASAAVLTPYFVKAGYTDLSAPFPPASYDTASISVYIDPATTNWIAWNNASSLVIPYAGCTSGFCLGPGAYGTDDQIELKVTNPGGSSLTATIDVNDGIGVSSGIQNVIYGTAATAPDALRYASIFATSTLVVFNDSGSHNAIFTTAGTYTFDFAWQNIATSGGSHQETWLLVETQSLGATPLPSALPLFASGLGALGLLGWRRKRKNAARAAA